MWVAELRLAMLDRWSILWGILRLRLPMDPMDRAPWFSLVASGFHGLALGEVCILHGWWFPKRRSGFSSPDGCGGLSLRGIGSSSRALQPEGCMHGSIPIGGETLSWGKLVGADR